MASIKQTFSKGITTLNVKTNNFMEQNKIKTYITTLESEINNLKALAGGELYEQWTNDHFEIAQLEENLKAISQKYEDIKIQQTRLEQLLIEERQILGTPQNNPGMQQDHPDTSQNSQPGNTIFCSQCGKPNAINYKFCAKCGESLR